MRIQREGEDGSTCAILTRDPAEVSRSDNSTLSPGAALVRVPVSILALQRTAGNAAITALLRGRGKPTSAVQRCGPVPCDCPEEATRTGEHGPASAVGPVSAVQREVSSTAPTVQRDETAAGAPARQEQVLALQRQGNRRSPSGAGVAQTPHDRFVVAEARRRLVLLERFLDEWDARAARQLGLRQEAADWIRRRERLDSTMVDPTGLPGARQAVEDANIRRLNRGPLTIRTSEDAVTILARFHVRFEDARHASRFSELCESVRAGIRLVWNQRMPPGMLSGRQFSVEPEFVQVARGAQRDLDRWLITVRPNNRSVATYERCTLPATDPDVPTSVTDSNCDGGVMSIPPSHIDRPGVLGHELMHLFGLIDRYVSVISRRPGQRAQVRNDPLRETRGRADPLGAQDARILSEDLGYLLQRLGVYAMDAERGLETLRRLERMGLTRDSVIAETARLQEVIRTGRDPRSLIPQRRDFNDRIIRDAENL